MVILIQEKIKGNLIKMAISSSSSKFHQLTAATVTRALSIKALSLPEWVGLYK